MSFTASLIVSLAGVVAANFIFRLLSRKTSEAIGIGAAVVTALFSLYPLSLWIFDGPHASFSVWMIWAVLGALTATGLRSLVGQKD